MKHPEPTVATKTSDEISSSRRKFMKSVSMTGVAAALPAIAPDSAAAATKAAGAPSNRIYMFANPFDEMPIKDAARIVAAAGYGGLDMTVRRGDLIDPTQVETALPKAVEVCKAAGLQTEMITTQITNPSDPVTEKILRAASKVGVKYFRFGNYSYNNYSSVREAQRQIKPMLVDLVAMCRQFGLRAAIQNHSGNGLSAAVWDLFYLIQDMDPYYIGFHYDSRHAQVEATGNYPSAYDAVSPYIHALLPKDFKWTVNTAGRASPSNQAIGQGIVDFDAYFKRARSFGINAPLSVMPAYGVFNDGSWHDAGTNIPSQAGEARLIAQMKADLDALRPSLVKYGYGWA